MLLRVISAKVTYILCYLILYESNNANWFIICEPKRTRDAPEIQDQQLLKYSQNPLQSQEMVILVAKIYFIQSVISLAVQ